MAAVCGALRSRVQQRLDLIEFTTQLPTSRRAPRPFSSGKQRMSDATLRPFCALPPRQSALPPAPTAAAAAAAAPLNLAQRLLATTPAASTDRRYWLTLTVLGAAALLAAAEPAMASDAAAGVHFPSFSPQPIADLAENEDFWANVLRYISYFFSVLLGTAYMAVKPLGELLKRPKTAVLVVVGLAGLYFFVSTTVGAMLGLNEIIEYEPASTVTPFFK